MIIVQKPSKNNICAIVVTYFPDSNFPERIRRITEQVDCVVIVDNNSGSLTIETLSKLSVCMNIDLILNDDNFGIAKALNQGVHKAQELGYCWILTLDQDTVVCSSMVKSLVNIIMKYSFPSLIGCIGSNFYLNKNRDTFIKESKNIEFQEMDEVITSGCLFNSTIFHQIGYFREDFFIDCVDREFCYRAKSFGYKILFSAAPLMYHNIGNPFYVKIGNKKKVACSNHNAVRRYYISRNNLIFIKEHKTSYKSVKFYIAYILSIIFERNSLKKIMAISLGLWHGICGKEGCLEKKYRRLIT